MTQRTIRYDRTPQPNVRLKGGEPIFALALAAIVCGLAGFLLGLAL